MEVSDKLKRLLSLQKKKKVASSPDDTAGGSKKLDQSLATACRQFFHQKVEFHCVESSDSHLDYLKSRYKPLNPSPSEIDMDTTPPGSADRGQKKPSASPSAHTDDIPKPKKELFDSSKLVLEWKSSRRVGAGLCNLGNTCFLNSVLQCLLYTPPLYNYLTSLDHQTKCEIL